MGFNPRPSYDAQVHRRLAAELFNRVWSLLEKPDRDQADDDTMIHAAHASRFHWGEVGETVSFARGEWQVSRVYAALGRAVARQPDDVTRYADLATIPTLA